MRITLPDMDHFQHIYSRRAADYHSMIAAEDIDSHLAKALLEVIHPHSRRILDIGTGTGRLPLLLVRQAGTMVGLDLHWDMLRENKAQRERVQGQWTLVQGDMRTLPVVSAWADVVTAGWAIGHLRAWFADNWQAQIGRVLSEMHRAVAPGGTLVILETLGTGSLTPAPPTPGLAEYYAWLEDEWGFRRQTISTDYQFANLADAVGRTEFFFGAEMAETIQRHGWARLPEWTGVWVKRVAGRR